MFIQCLLIIIFFCSFTFYWANLHPERKAEEARAKHATEVAAANAAAQAKQIEDAKKKYYQTVVQWKSHPLFADILECCCTNAAKVRVNGNGCGMRAGFGFSRNSFSIGFYQEKELQPGSYEHLSNLQCAHTYAEYGYDNISNPESVAALTEAIYVAMIEKFPNLSFIANRNTEIFTTFTETNNFEDHNDLCLQYPFGSICLNHSHVNVNKSFGFSVQTQSSLPPLKKIEF